MSWRPKNVIVFKPVATPPARCRGGWCRPWSSSGQRREVLAECLASGDSGDGASTTANTDKYFLFC